MVQFRAIPVFSLVVGTLVGDFGKAVAICWPWLAIVMATIGTILVMQPELAPVFTRAGAADAQMSSTAWLALGVNYALWFVAGSSMAVNWHRFLLRNDSPDGWEHLRLDGKVWRYAGSTLLISFIAVLVLVVFFIVIISVAILMRGGQSVVPNNPLALGLAFLLLIPVSLAVGPLLIIVMLRLSIKLPAIAVGDDYGLVDAWRDSRGYNIGLFGFALLLVLPTLFLAIGHLLVDYTLGLLMGAESLLKTVVTALAWVAMTWVNMMFAITGLAMLYAVFANGAEID